MNKENKCALCSHRRTDFYYRSAHNGICLVARQGCKFEPNVYSIIFAEELEKIKAEFLDRCQNYYRFDNEIILNGFEELIDKHIAELKGEDKNEL